MKPKRNNLIVVRAGDASLHPEWLNGSRSRNFDIYVSYFGKQPGTFEHAADYYESVPGLKYPVLADLYRKERDLLLSYEACWFPDDDLSTNAEVICQMFDLFHECDLWLAQPALSPGSYVSYPCLVQNPETRLRYAGFVEVMCPIFKRNTLEFLSPTFSLSASGWGLDLLWPHILNYPRGRIAILDETPVIHTRPVGSGSFYAHCARIGINPEEDLKQIVNHYKLDWLVEIPIYGAIPKVPNR